MARSSFTPAQKKAMLWVVAFLAALRFIGMPLVEYQEEQKQNLAMTTQQLERAQRLLDAEGSSDSLDRVAGQRSALEERFIRHATDGEFRLQAQQQIQRVFEANEAQVELFDWLAREERADGYLRVHLARINVQGLPPRLVQAQLDLLEQVPGVQVLEYTLTPQRATARRGSQQRNARLNLLVEVAGVRQ